MDTALINETLGIYFPAKYVDIVKFGLVGLFLLVLITGILQPICTTVLTEYYPSCQISYGVIFGIIILGFIACSICVCMRKLPVKPEEISEDESPQQASETEDCSDSHEPDGHLLAGNEKSSTSTSGVNIVTKQNVDADVAKINTKGDGKGNVIGLNINADGPIKLKADEINTDNTGK